MKFEIDAGQMAKLKAWSAKRDAEVCKAQMKSKDPFTRAEAKAGRAYYGAAGGQLEYCFSPTSLGDSLVVKHAATKAKIDLTDYDAW